MLISLDELILARLRDGSLRVDRQTGRVWQLHQVRFCNPKAAPRWDEKRPSWSESKGRWRFHFQFGGRKTTVNRARLLLLARELRPVEVADHADEDRTNDAPANVREHARAESDAQGRRLQRERATAAAALTWFDWLARTGREPPDGELIPW